MTITLDALTLPDGLLWVDELDWTPVQQSETYTLTGALVLESGIKQAGRPITLQGGESYGWISRTVLLAVQALVAANSVHTLTLHDARTFQVCFRQGSGPLSANLILLKQNPAGSDWYNNVILRLMTV